MRLFFFSFSRLFSITMDILTQYLGLCCFYLWSLKDVRISFPFIHSKAKLSQFYQWPRQTSKKILVLFRFEWVHSRSDLKCIGCENLYCVFRWPGICNLRFEIWKFLFKKFVFSHAENMLFSALGGSFGAKAHLSFTKSSLRFSSIF